MDDDLMRLFGGENIKGLMSRIGMSQGEPIYHPWLNKSLEKAQKKVEERNFEIRKHLLEYDDVLNQQRKFIYEQRDAILGDKDLKERVNGATADMLGGFIDEFRAGQRQSGSGAIKNLTENLKTRFDYVLKAAENEIKNPEALEKRIVEDLNQDIANKEGIIGSEYLNYIIREQYLMMIDRKWLDHLENMEALREAVYLRSYAQKNPLTEYKVEGFRIFETMIDDIRQVIASRLHLVRIQAAENRDMSDRPLSRSASYGTASHGSINAFGGASGSASKEPARMQSENATMIRSQPKVGRNDLCPCGSGKKYKLCHGR
jgi:preprotein translocase subunit SecA